MFAYFDVGIGHRYLRNWCFQGDGVLPRTSRSKPPELPGAEFVIAVAAGQPFDLQAELAQSLLREVDLPVFKGILAGAAHKEQEYDAIALRADRNRADRLALCDAGHEACGGGEVEQAIVAVHGAIEFAQLGVRYVIAGMDHVFAAPGRTF